VIRFTCSACAAKLNAPNDKTGKTAACPSCGARQRVPGGLMREEPAVEIVGPEKESISSLPLSVLQLDQLRDASVEDPKEPGNDGPAFPIILDSRLSVEESAPHDDTQLRTRPRDRQASAWGGGPKQGGGSGFLLAIGGLFVGILATVAVFAVVRENSKPDKPEYLPRVHVGTFEEVEMQRTNAALNVQRLDQSKPRGQSEALVYILAVVGALAGAFCVGVIILGIGRLRADRQ
jgi:hypothetical protein